MLSKLSALFLDHAAASLDKQLSLGDMLGEHEWTFDMQSGKITFTSGRLLSRVRRTFAAQILGTESEVSNTWLWSWANTQSEIPARMLYAANRLKAKGQNEGIPEFTDPSFPLNTITGHQVAMIASGLLAADCYYRGPYENGAIYVLIKDPSFSRPKYDPRERIAEVFPQLLSAFDIVDHKRALLAYFGFYGLHPAEKGDMVLASSPGGELLLAEFDKTNRLVALTIDTEE